MWTNKQFNYDFLKPFGCLTYYLKPQQLRSSKMANTGEKGILLGFVNDFSSYKILSFSGSYAVTREVKFDENEFPGLNKNELMSDIDPFRIEISQNENHKNQNNVEQNNQIETEVNQNINTENDDRAPQEISSRISTDNILNYDRRGNIININLAESYFIEPKYFHQAINSPESEKWKEAIEKELDNMNDHQVWEVVDKKENDKLLNCTWVFKIKKDSENAATEYKARLCVQGFKQTEGLDYFTTFAPTGKLTSL